MKRVDLPGVTSTMESRSDTVDGVAPPVETEGDHYGTATEVMELRLRRLRNTTSDPCPSARVSAEEKEVDEQEHKKAAQANLPQRQSKP